MTLSPDALRVLADGLLAAAVNQPLPAERSWHGFQIAMQIHGERRRLVIGRRDRPPTPDEARTIAAEFGAPEDTPGAAGKRKVRHPETGLPVTYHVVELTWRERG